MSRGIKDLRDLICLSRLTFRDSESEDYASSDSHSGSLDNVPLTALTSGEAREPSGQINGSDSPAGRSSASSDYSKARRRKKKKRKKAKPTHNVTHVPLIDFPKAAVLPAVKSKTRPAEIANGGCEEPLASAELDRVLRYADTTVVSDWLERANKALADLTQWCCCEKRFVAFVHFWLSEFPSMQRQDILKLEFDIALDEMNVAFSAGLQSDTVTSVELARVMAAVYREYPHKLNSSAGTYLFLDYLDTFTSERALDYRRILTDVKLSTQSKEHTHYLLAARSFVLISSWSAIVMFFRKLSPASTVHAPAEDLDEPNHRRACEAVRVGHVDVIHYLFRSGKVAASAVDRQGRTFAFIAVAGGQHVVLDYLLSKWAGCTDINRPCDTGNSPLHVASNHGNARMIARLLEVPDLDANAANPQCDGATAVHLAAMHGHADIVRLLLASGKVDPTRLMGNVTALDFAKQLDQTDVVKAFEEFLG